MKKLLQSKQFQALLGVGISLAIITWMYLTVEWDQVWHILKRSHYWAFIPALFLFLIHFLLRAWRWKYLLPKLGTREEVGIRSLFDSVLMGVFGTFILPLRAGEFVRPYLLSVISPHSFSSAFVSVVIERFFDLIFVLLSFGLMLFFMENIPDLAFQGAVMLAGLALAILLFIIISSTCPASLTALIERFAKFIPTFARDKIKKFLLDLIHGSAVLRSWQTLASVLGLTVMVWLSNYLVFYQFMFLFDIPATFWMAVALSVVLALAVAAPSAPGFLGVYQIGCIAGFALFGIDKEVAVAYSLITHVFQYVIFILYGLFLLFKYNLGVSDLRGVLS